MKTKTSLLLIILVSFFVGCGTPPSTPGEIRSPEAAPTSSPTTLSASSTPTQVGRNKPLEFSQISFDDIAPAGMDMQQCWNGMGMDDYELPMTDKRIIDNTYAITLSPDETKLYYVVSVVEKPGGPEYTGSGGSGELYYYDLVTSQLVFVQQLPVGIYTSADLRDGENIYFSHFGGTANIWSGNPRLFILHVPPQLQEVTWLQEEP